MGAEVRRVVLLLFFLCGCGEKPQAERIPQLAAAVDNAQWEGIISNSTQIAKKALEAGMILGWELHRRGASGDDFAAMRNAAWTNNHAFVEKWLNEHKP